MVVDQRCIIGILYHLPVLFLQRRFVFIAIAPEYLLFRDDIHRHRAFQPVVAQIFSGMLCGSQCQPFPQLVLTGVMQFHLLFVLSQIRFRLPIRPLIPALGRDMLQVAYQIIKIMLEKTFMTRRGNHDADEVMLIC